MKIVRSLLLSCVCLVSAAVVAVHAGDEMSTIALPKPDMTGGKPLMQALKERQTGRTFSPAKLPLQMMSDLLWAANGINRPGTDKRTAPTAHNWQEIDVYVAMADGLFFYDAKKHQLVPVLKDDLRAASGKQDFVKDAPVNLIFVADYAKMGKSSEKDQELYAATDTGFVSQNVYLYCASAELATVVRGYLDREALAKAMKLRPEQKVILAQTVGYPKKG